MNEYDGDPRGTNWLRVGSIAVIAVLLFGAIGYVIGSKAMPGNSQYSAALGGAVPGIEPDNSAIPAYSGPPPADQSAPPPATDANMAHPAAGPSANPMDGSVAKDDGTVIDDNGLAVPESAPDDSADRQGSSEIAQAIRDATMTALDQGGSVRWKKDGLSGYAVVSSAITLGRQTCREVYSTTLRDDGETRTPPVRWCKIGDDGEWQAR